MDRRALAVFGIYLGDICTLLTELWLDFCAEGAGFAHPHVQRP